MDLARGAVVGATIGAFSAYAMRAFAPAQQLDHNDPTFSVAPHLIGNPLLAASFQRLGELKDANAEAEQMYASMLTLCERLLQSEHAETKPSKFRLNRMCSEFRRSLKQLCAAAGMNREFTEAARTLLATESGIIEEFCERYLYNMVLGR